MSSKSKAKLEEELGQVQADLSAALDELTEIKITSLAETEQFKQGLKDGALKAEAARVEEFDKATEAYQEIVTKATVINATVQAQNPDLLGTAGQVARDGILATLKEIFGDL